MSDLLFFAVDPDPNFVDRLESLLLAEIERGPASAERRAENDLDPVVPFTPTAVRTQPHHRTRRIITVISVAAAVVAIVLLALMPGDHRPEKPPDTTQVPTTLNTPASAVPFPKRQATLVPGTTYSIGRLVLQRALQITSTTSGLQGIASAGRLWVLGDEKVYVTLTDISLLRVFSDPLFDPTGTTDFPDKMVQATQPMPQDPLAWAAALPGITVGEITETTFGGRPARALTYRFSDVAGAYACPGSTSTRCVTGLYVAGDDSTGVFLPGDNMTLYWQTDSSGTLYELTLDGVTYLVDVANVDGAAELAASIVIGN